MNANIQFYDGMSTTKSKKFLYEAQTILSSLESPNYQYAAARLLSYSVNKEVFGEYNAITLQKILNVTLTAMYTMLRS